MQPDNLELALLSPFGTPELRSRFPDLLAVAPARNAKEAPAPQRTEPQGREIQSRQAIANYKLSHTGSVLGIFRQP